MQPAHAARLLGAEFVAHNGATQHHAAGVRMSGCGELCAAVRATVGSILGELRAAPQLAAAREAAGSAHQAEAAWWGRLRTARQAHSSSSAYCAAGRLVLGGAVGWTPTRACALHNALTAWRIGDAAARDRAEGVVVVLESSRCQPALLLTPGCTVDLRLCCGWFRASHFGAKVLGCSYNNPEQGSSWSTGRPTSGARTTHGWIQSCHKPAPA